MRWPIISQMFTPAHAWCWPTLRTERALPDGKALPSGIRLTVSIAVGDRLRASNLLRVAQLVDGDEWPADTGDHASVSKGYKVRLAELATTQNDPLQYGGRTLTAKNKVKKLPQ
jgi:hypothetical protein